MRRISASVLALLIALLMPIELGTGVGRAIAAMAGSAAPSFELVTFAGEAYDDHLLKGEPVLLVFWAPWCKVCQRELPLMGQFYRQDRPAQLRVVAIGFADTRTNVEAFVKARPSDFVFPTAYDEDRWVAQAFKITATPTYVLVDARGQIVLVHRGGGLLQNMQFREFLSTLKG
ncbi:MAG: TlpA family protein disulfide reductase [Nitrospiraceae bacterium]